LQQAQARPLRGLANFVDKHTSRGRGGGGEKGIYPARGDIPHPQILVPYEGRTVSRPDRVHDRVPVHVELRTGGSGPVRIKPAVTDPYSRELRAQISVSLPRAVLREIKE
jgi:hypothetical protein